MKVPNAEHPITISQLPERLVVRFKGVIVAQTDNALKLQEAKYPAVYYVPRADIETAYFQRSAHTTYCPYKGPASYFNLVVAGERADNAVWSYETPYPAMAEIKDHVAFYVDQVTFELEAV